MQSPPKKVVLNQKKYASSDCSGSVESAAINTMSKNGIVFVENNKFQRNITCQDQLFDRIKACTCNSLLSALHSVPGCQNGLLNDCTDTPTPAPPTPAPAGPSCCWDFDESQWKMTLTRYVKDDVFFATETNIRSGGNCLSNVSAPPLGGGVPPPEGIIVSQVKLGLDDHNLTFVIDKRWQANGTHTLSCKSYPGVDCSSTLSAFVFPKNTSKLCFGAADKHWRSKFVRNVSVGDVEMQLFNDIAGQKISALVNVAKNCAVVGIGLSFLPSFFPTEGSYYDVRAAHPSPGTFDIPKVCYRSDGSFT